MHKRIWVVRWRGQQWERKLVALMAANGGTDDSYVNERCFGSRDAVTFTWQAGGLDAYDDNYWYASGVQYDLDPSTLAVMGKVMRLAAKHRDEDFLGHNLQPAALIELLLQCGALPLKRLDFEPYDHCYIVDKNYKPAEAFPPFASKQREEAMAS